MVGEAFRHPHQGFFNQHQLNVEIALFWSFIFFRKANLCIIMIDVLS
jgi:hypothetical protein